MLPFSFNLLNRSNSAILSTLAGGGVLDKEDEGVETVFFRLSNPLFKSCAGFLNIHAKTVTPIAAVNASQMPNPKPALPNPKPPLEDNIVITTESNATPPQIIAANHIDLSSASVCVPSNAIIMDATKAKNAKMPQP